jgi:hypothetical protein
VYRWVSRLEFVQRPTSRPRSAMDLRFGSGMPFSVTPGHVGFSSESDGIRHCWDLTLSANFRHWPVDQELSALAAPLGARITSWTTE